MDDAKKVLLILLSVFTLAANATDDVEYVSPAKQKELEVLFAQAQGPKHDAKWSCDMYGVRTRMQVQHGLELYTLKDEGGHKWSNQGAQPLTSYQETEQELKASNEKFQDEIKFAQDGRLISRLTLNSNTKPVLAYAVCKAI